MQTANRLSFSSGSEAIMYIGKLVLSNKTDIEFNLDDSVRRSIYKKAYLSFTGARACKEENIDPRKGTWLIGGTGVGKSTL
jgi:putative ribosome biogenesis GTPase RsgA